jgi:GT2 family glycosyltransferase
MSFSIIIPSRDASNLVPCIRAIREAGETARIIVVDDFPYPLPDGFTWQTSGLDLSRDLVVTGQDPFVFARNVNIGIRAAGDDDVILLNDDALLKTPMGFTHLMSAASASPEFGCIGAVTNMTGQPAQHPKGVGLRDVGHIAFVCVYIPRSTIRRFGMLDERYCLDYGVEDLDYCEAIARAGMKVGVLDDCFVDHASLRSSYRGEPHASRSFAKNYALFREKWGIA